MKLLNNDPIYVMLAGAREKLFDDYLETVKNMATMKILYGEAIYQDVLDRLEEEHEKVSKDLDARIERRIGELADMSIFRTDHTC